MFSTHPVNVFSIFIEPYFQPLKWRKLACKLNFIPIVSAVATRLVNKIVDFREQNIEVGWS